MVTSKDTDGIRGLFEGEMSMHIDHPLDKSVAKASEFTRIFTSRTYNRTRIRNAHTHICIHIY